MVNPAPASGAAVYTSSTCVDAPCWALEAIHHVAILVDGGKDNPRGLHINLPEVRRALQSL